MVVITLDVYMTICMSWVYMHTVSEADFRLKKYMTNETYIFRQVNMSVFDDIKNGNL